MDLFKGLMQHISGFLQGIEAARKRSAYVKEQFVWDMTNVSDVALFDGELDNGLLFSDYTGLCPDMFPDERSLSVAEIHKMVDELVGLFRCYGLNPIFHPLVSNRMKYLQMRDFCHQVVYPNPGEMVDVEFCDYRSGQCPYAKDCHLAHLLINNCVVFKIQDRQYPG